MKRLLLFPIFALALLTAGAQDITKEIVIDRDIEADLGAATRVATYPEVLTPTVEMPKLKFVDRTEYVEPLNLMTPLAPAKWGNACSVSKHNGYAAVGYFPPFNVGASIGYRFVNNKSTSLGAWLQYNGNTYKDLEDERFDRNTLTFGVDFSHTFRKVGRLQIALDYTWNALNRPWETSGVAVPNHPDVETDSTYQTNQLNFLAKWSARKHDIDYFADIQMNHFGFDNLEYAFASENTLKPKLSQNVGRLEAGAKYYITEKATLGCDANVDFVNYSAMNRMLFEPVDADDPAKGNAPFIIGNKGRTLGLITLNPAFGYHNDRVTAKLGINAQVTVNSGRTFHIAPDVSVSYRPDWWVSVNAAVDGGEHINRLSTLFNRMPYMSVSLPYEFSHIPLDMRLSLRFGQIHGVSLELFGGYSAANDWLMPMQYAKNCVTYAPVDLSCWHYGVKVGVRAAGIVDVDLKYEGSPGSYSHASRFALDRAQNRLDAKVTVTPFSRLTVGAGFHLRAGRSLYAWNDGAPASKTDLGSYTSLNVAGRFVIFDWLSVFGDIENVLNNRALEVWMHERQGIKGLFGVELKF